MKTVQFFEVSAMKSRIAALFAALFVSGAAGAGEDICRSLSASWSKDGADFRTTLWESAADISNGACHKIEHSVVRAGEVTTFEGADCNCDLIMDGAENNLSGGPHVSTAARLKALCAAPAKAPPSRVY